MSARSGRSPWRFGQAATLALVLVAALLPVVADADPPPPDPTTTSEVTEPSTPPPSTTPTTVPEPPPTTATTVPEPGPPPTTEAPETEPVADAAGEPRAPRGRITIVKDARPNSPQNFRFSIRGRDLARRFWLDDDADPARPRSRTFTRLRPGRYIVTEARASGWDLTGIRCSRPESIQIGRRRVVIDLTRGERVTCVFTNTNTIGRLHILQETVPSGAAVAFEFSETFPAFVGPQPPSFHRSLADGETWTISSPPWYLGDPLVTQELASGWRLREIVCSGTPATTVDVASGTVRWRPVPGGDTTCRFVNEPVSDGAITWQPAGELPGTFEFGYEGPGSIVGSAELSCTEAGSCEDETLSELVAGSYLLTQFDFLLSVADPTDPRWGYLGSISCESEYGTSTFVYLQDDTDPRRGAVRIDYGYGDSVHCIFRQEVGGAITVVKDVPGDDPRDFFFTPSWQTGFRLDDDTDPTHPHSITFPDLRPGTHTLAEAAADGWSLTGLTCTPDQAVDLESRTVIINLPADTEVTCAFVNERDVGSGTLTVVKETPLGHFRYPVQFGFVLEEPTSDPLRYYSSGQVDVGGTHGAIGAWSFVDVPAGSYRLYETGMANWRYPDEDWYEDTALSCTAGGIPVQASPGPYPDTQWMAEIDLTAGASVTCTFTNEARSSLAFGHNAAETQFFTGWLGWSPRWEFLVEGPEGIGWTGSSTCTAIPDHYACEHENNDRVDLPPGTWTITETVSAPETLLWNISCADRFAHPDFSYQLDLESSRVVLELPGMAEVACWFHHFEGGIGGFVTGPGPPWWYPTDGAATPAVVTVTEVAPARDGLPRTGTDLDLVPLAVALIGAGVLALVVRRRRAVGD